MKQILVNFSENMIQSALVDDGKLIEVMVERKEAVSIVGNVYIGIVKNILPSQFAFVDIGQGKNAFLHLADSKESDLYAYGKLQLKIGQTLIVQVMKDASGTKGAAITTQISFAGKTTIIFLSKEPSVGISKKIEAINERKRLKKIAKSVLPEKGFGLILRTESEGKPANVLKDETEALIEFSEKIMRKAQFVRAPGIVHQADRVLEQSIKSFVDPMVRSIIVNDMRLFETVRAIASEAGFDGAVQVYSGDIPLFIEYGVEAQFRCALSKKVWLPSGGFIVIEQTEACVVVDVNTGRFIGSKSLQKTIIDINREAALEIAAQIRLRNLSGMIIIDFIDMKAESEKAKLVGLLEDALKADRLAVSMLGMVHLGVVMLTRKKEREPLARLLQGECPYCHGSGLTIL